MIAGKWAVFPRPGEQHVIPLNDSREHKISRGCWCKPHELQGMTHAVYAHHADDCRELFEEAAAIIINPDAVLRGD